jgi:hypothetical protein
MRATFACLLLGCALLLACSSTPQPAETVAKPATPAANQKVPDYEFEPLSQADVDLYLGIMREAIQRFRSLPDQDRAALKAESDFYKSLKTGKNPPPTPEQQAIMKRGIEIHHLDYDIAASKGVRPRYEAIAETIEGMVGPEKCGDSDCGQGPDEDDAALRKKQIEDDKKRKAIVKQDLALLQPYAPEILAMATELRMMPQEQDRKKK